MSCDSYRAIQHHEIENAQELACTYPEPPPTFQDITDSHHQNPAEECAKMQEEVPCISSKGDYQPLHLINQGHGADAQDLNSCLNSSEPSVSTSYKQKPKAEQPKQPSKQHIQPITASQEGLHSFAILCSSFLSLLIKDRLQFLS